MCRLSLGLGTVYEVCWSCAQVVGLEGNVQLVSRRLGQRRAGGYALHDTLLHRLNHRLLVWSVLSTGHRAGGHSPPLTPTCVYSPIFACA